MAVPYTKGNPSWLHTQDTRNSRYYRRLYQAWPEWCISDPRFKEIYEEAKSLGFTVDHTVPICSDIVCGLHVPWNLVIIGAGANLSKGNHWWPDHPFENLQLI